jgi:3',5'-cyclic AMP phosphodiesterase CpdA
VSAPFLLVQLSDPHIGAVWGGGDPVAMLAAAVDSVRALRPAPDAILVSGDLADHGADAEYELVRELLASLAMPLYVVVGNHDDRDALHRHFGVPGENGDPVQYAADLGPLRLVVLDSKCVGADRGELDAGRLTWLDTELAAVPDAPTVLAMHHPPLVTGSPALDRIGLPAADRRALGEVVGRNRQVRLLVGGHVHRTVAAELGGRTVLAVPSTYVQARLDFESGQLQFAADPAGFAVHVLSDGDLSSHVQLVGERVGSWPRPGSPASRRR